MEKELNFFDALAKAGDERAVRYNFGTWRRFVLVGSGHATLRGIGGDTTEWWPAKEERVEKNWEVAPEDPKVIFVWGACDNRGYSYLFMHKPSALNSAGYYVDQLPCKLSEDNLFLKDKPQKFILYPVKDNA